MTSLPDSAPDDILDDVLEKLYNAAWVEGSTYDDTLEQAGADTEPRSTKELRSCTRAKAAIRAAIQSALPEKCAVSRSLGKDYAGYSRGYNAAISEIEANLKKKGLLE
jgi:hypothetical protein